MNIVSIVFGQIVMMFCMMAVGAAAYKAGLITERGSTDLMQTYSMEFWLPLF